MQRGISPIVAVVLLIAIAVVSAVGLYFFAGGLATRQPTPQTPIVISAHAIDPASGLVAVANLGSSAMYEPFLYVAEGGTCNFSSSDLPILPGQQAVCTMAPRSGTSTLYGVTAGSATLIVSPQEVSEVSFRTSYRESSWFDTGTGSHFNTVGGSVELNDGRWWRNIILGGAGNQFGPSAGAGPTGILHIAYHNGGSGHVYYANSASSWEPVAIDTTAGTKGGVSLAVDETGGVHLAWHSGGDIYYAKSPGWSIVSVNAEAEDQLYPELAVGSDGHAHIAWRDGAAGSYSVRYATSSNGWTPSTVDSAVASQNGISIFLDSGGVPHLAWHANKGGNEGIYYANSSAAWAINTIVEDALATRSSPSMAVKADGAAHVVWIKDSLLMYANSGTNWAIVEANGWAGLSSSPRMVLADGLLRIVFVLDQSGGGILGSNVIIFKNELLGEVPKIWDETIIPEWPEEPGFDDYPSIAFHDGAAHVFWDCQGDWTDICYSAESYPLGSGHFISNPSAASYDMVVYNRVDWNRTEPAQTGVELMVYFSNTSDFAQNVSEIVVGPFKELSTVANYSKYRLDLASDFVNRPKFNSITFSYHDVMAEISYTVNSQTELSWVALNSSCHSAENPIVNETASGTFYTNTITNSTSCNYTVFGPGISDWEYGL